MSSSPSYHTEGFKVSGFRPFRKGALRGYLTVTTGSGMIVHDVSLFQGEDGQRWVRLPSRKFEKTDGTDGYRPLIEFVDRECSNRFRDAVLCALDASDAANGGRP